MKNLNCTIIRLGTQICTLKEMVLYRVSHSLRNINILLISIQIFK